MLLTFIAIIAAFTSGVGAWIFSWAAFDAVRDAWKAAPLYPKADWLDHALLAFAVVGACASFITAMRQIIPSWLTY